MALLQQFLFGIQYLVIVDVNFDSFNDLVRLVIMCYCKFGQSPCMTYLYGCHEYLKNIVEHDLFWDATWCVGLEDPMMYSTQSHKKTWHAQFCCKTKGIDPYVPTYTTRLYMCQGTRYPICGYQSSTGMLQDSKFKITWNYFVMHLSYTITTMSFFLIKITSISYFKLLKKGWDTLGQLLEAPNSMRQKLASPNVLP
jgi:hypothetical protein